jgi:lecithin-cholesterol acyltransferase
MQRKSLTLGVLLLITLASYHTAKSIDLLEAGIEDYHETIRSEVGHLDGWDEVDPKHLESLQNTLGATQFLCTNGKDPKTLTNQQYITEFAKGDCNPIVILPGIAGSKLIVEINCQEFKDNNKAAFSACGWSSCSFLAPKSEYKMWIPETLAPMSVSLPSSGARKCFAAVFGFDASQVKQGGNLVQRKGLKVSVLGTSPKTMKKSDGSCAFDAIMNMGTTGSQTPGTAVFAAFKSVFENAGYKNGVNMQALPYDFRLAYQKNELNSRFPAVINELFSNWGKKITIFAHSFGNYQAVHNLVKMPQGDKDKMIARYMSLGAPFLGAP